MKRTAAGRDEVGGGRGSLVFVAVALATLVAFANGLTGDFVYDDVRQVLDNHFLRDADGLRQGLASDVWAFKGEREEAWSNYWRPAFVLWLAALYGLFGTASTLPWHLASLFLHLLATALAMALARRLRLPTLGAAAVALVFAVHPAHVESVIWISGAPDLLAAVGCLGALLLWLDGARAVGAARALRWGAALLCYVLALTSKEVSVVLGVLVPMALWARDPERPFVGRHWAHGLPFAALAGVYLGARRAVLGLTSIDVPWALGPVETLLTLPSVVAFYLRQAFFPWVLGPSYPLRAVYPGATDFANLGGPLLFVAAFAVAAVVAGRRHRAAAFGLALFAALLTPALNFNAFIQEQLVHDRYLYLPLLGLCLAVAAVALPARPRSQASSPRRVAVAVVAVAVLLGARTFAYNRVWRSELALWQHGVEVDPGSGFNWSQLADALSRAGRPAEALAAAERALAIRAVTNAYLLRGELLADAGRWREAERDLRRVLDAYPAHVGARERLAIVYQRSGELPAAEDLLRRGRDLAPHRRCAFTVNLAVVLYLQGDRTGALSELERVPELLASEPHGGCSAGLFHLGNLYSELSRESEARVAWSSFLAASAGAHDERTLDLRRRAATALAAPARNPDG